MSKIIILITLIITFASCSSVNKSYKNTSIDISIKSPMRAKVEVDMTRKLTGYASGGFLFHFFHISGDSKFLTNIRFNGQSSSIFQNNLNLVKGAAAYNAVSGSDADILVDPQYVLEESKWNPIYKEIKVKVTGYAGKVVKIMNE